MRKLLVPCGLTCAMLVACSSSEDAAETGSGGSAGVGGSTGGTAGTGGSSGQLGSGGAAGSGGSAGSSGAAGSAGSAGNAGSSGAAGAAGSAGSGGSSGAGGAGGSGGGSGGSGGGGDKTPPTVVSTSPSNSQAGVSSGANIVITFSEPMNKGSAQLAYQSASIPAAQSVITWNAAGTQMTVNPNANLVYATGTNPATVKAKAYSFTVTTTAQDLAGNGLAQNHTVTFTTLREITQTLTPTAVNTVRSDGFLAASTTVITAGDVNTGLAFRGFLTFNVSSLPPGIGGAWQQATLELTQVAGLGTPYTSLGTLQADSLTYSTPNLAAFNKGDDNYNLAIPAAGTTKSINVLLPMALSIYGKRSSAQFRIGFTKLTDGDGGHDTTGFSNQKLILKYRAP